MPFDDPWLNYGPIITAPRDRVEEIFSLDAVTPRLVEKLVRAAIGDGWEPDGHGAPMRLVLGRDGVVAPDNRS
ncbi:hypothetical protein [Rugosimonospora acidiphila]|uniref:hypothetical protein n=1 Tax=Rugosimonospora acidiphila TaxID=556531 RepID=UPI0031ECDC21